MKEYFYQIICCIVIMRAYCEYSLLFFKVYLVYLQIYLYLLDNICSFFANYFLEIAFVWLNNLTIEHVVNRVVVGKLYLQIWYMGKSPCGGDKANIFLQNQINFPFSLKLCRCKINQDQYKDLIPVLKPVFSDKMQI